MNLSVIGVGVIGVGGQGEEHVRAYAALPDVRILGVCDADAARAESVALRYGIPLWTARASDLLALPDLQAVSIATPEVAHLEPSFAAFAAGKHVLLEKPIATRVEEARQLFSAAERAGCILMPAHVLRFHPAYTALKERLARGELGRPVSLSARRNLSRGRAARFHRAHSFLEVLVHDIDLALWYTESRPERVYAVERRVLHDGPADAVWGIVQFAGGAVAALECHWLWPEGRRAYVESLFRLVTTESVAEIADPSAALVVTDDRGQEIPDTALWPLVRGEATGALVAQAAAFIRAVRRQEQPAIVRPDEVIAGLETALALVRSAQEGREILV